MRGFSYRNTLHGLVCHFVAALTACFATYGIHSFAEHLGGSGQVAVIIFAVTLVVVSLLMVFTQIKVRTRDADLVLRWWMGMNFGVGFGGYLVMTVGDSSFITALIIIVLFGIGSLAIDRRWRKLPDEA